MDRPPSLRLRVGLVPSPSCFVALPPSLYQELLLEDIPPSQHAWEISWIDARGIHKACVSWSGEISNVPGFISIPVKFGELLGLHQGQEISLVHLPNVPPAEQVFVEPLTSDDWEILERHGAYLEDHILNIACAVYEGLTLPIWIRHNTLLLVKVVTCRPTPCVRLQPETEVLISPKLRQQPNKSEGVNHKGGKNGPIKRTLRIQENSDDIDCPVGHVLVHPTNLKSFSWNEGCIVAIFNAEGEKKARSEIFSIPQQQSQQAGASAQVRVPMTGNASGGSMGAVLSQLQSQIQPTTGGNEAENRLSCVKAYTYAKVKASELVSVGHIHIPICMKEELQARSLTKISVKPVVHTNSPIKSLSIHHVNWKGERVQEPIVPSLILSDFRKCIQEISNLTDSPIPFSSGSIFEIKHDSEGTATSRHYVLYANGQTFKLEEQKGSPIPIPSETPEFSYEEKWKHLLRHPYYYLKEGEVPKDITVGSSVILQGAEKWHDSPYDIEDFGGMEMVTTECKEFVSNILLRREYRRSVGLPPCGGLLLTGIHGCGKSTFGHALCKYFRKKAMCYTCYVGCREISGDSKDTIRGKLENALRQAISNSPSILFLDDLDVLVPTTGQENDTFMGTQMAEVLECLFQEAVKKDTNICLFVTAQSEASLHSTLLSPHIFDKTLNIAPPDRKDRTSILQKIIQRQSLNSVGLNMQQLANMTEGYVGSDLENIVSRATHTASIRAAGIEPVSENFQDSLRLTQVDFLEAIDDYTPVSLKGIKLHKSETTWEDIGGLNEVKSILRETLEWPTKYSRLFEATSLRLRSGLLLFGPPGCGKTMIAGAVAKECGLNFISIKGPEMLNKYIGASEQAVRDVFLRASAAKPSILFFDEFDSIAPRRGHDSTGVTDRVVNQLLTQLDGVEGLHGVYVLAATSRPDLIDPALLRPGRLDKSLFCGMPDADERIAIMKALSRKMKLASNIDWEKLAELTDGRSGADLQAILYNAQLEAIHELIDEPESDSANATVRKDIPIHIISPSLENERLTAAEKAHLADRIRNIRNQLFATEPSEARSSDTEDSGNTAREGPKLQMNQIVHAIENTQPSVSKQERLRYERIYQDFLSSHGNFNSNQNAGQKTTLA